MSHSSSQTFLRELDKKLWTAAAKLPPGTEIKECGRLTHPYQITSTGKLIDDALEAMEKENPKLKNVPVASVCDRRTLNHRIARRTPHDFEPSRRRPKLRKTSDGRRPTLQLQIDPANLAGLIDLIALIATIPFHCSGAVSASYETGTVAGRRFTAENILGQDQESTASDSSSAFLGDLCAFAVKNSLSMAIRGIDFDFGKEPADTFTRDQHPDLRADFVMANPPFNIKEWWDGKLEGDARWKYGTPPQGNANFAWVQHMLHHLAPNGSMALLLANGSMSSNSSGEGDIRRALIEADLVECMVALPGQLFTNTQIPACIWFLTKNKAKRSRPGAAALRDRRGETLFIDARKLGFMKDRVLRDFSNEDTKKIAGTFRNWRTGTYEDVSGFCNSSNLQQIAANAYSLTPGRFVGAEDVEGDGELFEDKIARLVAELTGQFAESAKLEKAINLNLKGLGYEG